ncbi:MAG TPA: hypothetical protein VF552_11115 [Allosphingosinicella sp.]|jgi:hypothetical protein
MKPIATALAALALAAAPTAASAAPQPIEPASESADGSALRGGAIWILPALILVALLIAILAGEGGDEMPASP